MIRERATVVAWQDGIAILRLEMKTSCGSCLACDEGCGSYMLNKLVSKKNANLIKINSAHPLQLGQGIELGIAEISLLSSAFLVYIIPLIGVFTVAGIFQLLFHSDLVAASGALLGGVCGFIAAKFISCVLGRSGLFQPVILGVALPSDELHVKHSFFYKDYCK